MSADGVVRETVRKKVYMVFWENTREAMQSLDNFFGRPKIEIQLGEPPKTPKYHIYGIWGFEGVPRGLSRFFEAPKTYPEIALGTFFRVPKNEY